MAKASAPGERREYLTIQEAAERCGFSQDTIRRRISDGTLPAYRAKGTTAKTARRAIRIKASDLHLMMDRIPVMDGAA